jgi:hypothetical protein
MGEESTITGMGGEDVVLVIVALWGVVPLLAARKAAHSLVERLGASTTKSAAPPTKGISFFTRASAMREVLRTLVE